MSTDPTATELLADLAPILSARGLRWYLFGAQAVILHGRPRLTADVDVTVEIDRRNVPALVEELASAGFSLRVADPEEFVEQTWVLPLCHARTGIPLDIVLAGSGLEERFLDRVVEFELAGVTVPVLRREDLVVAKMLAGRPKDLEDVVGVLLAAGDDFAVDEVRDLLGEIGSAVDEDLLGPFDRILSRPSPKIGDPPAAT